MTMQLSEAQKQAVEYVDGPTLVTAGAGSGKTRTLTAKIAHLVTRLGYDPAAILAITFTNKAAEEMKGRLEQATGLAISRFPWVRTFHSACFQILKEHCEWLGYHKPITIHSDYQQKTDAKKVLIHLDLDRKYLGPLRSLISRAKNSGIPYDYLSANGRLPRMREAYDLYNEILARQNAVDFDDILLLTRDLLEKNQEVRERFRAAFDYILIDEFQDSNPIQNAIVDLLLRNGNLTVVGDDYQSIYQFRGADPLHFIDFPNKYPTTRIFRLERNYRSTEPIVAATDALIAHNRSRIDKTCYSTRPGPLIQLAEFLDENQEASWVARRCWEYRNYRKIPLERMAVLYRTRFCSLALERAMRTNRLPYQMMGGSGFFERREVQDLNAYLICAVNPRDDASFERIVNVPKRGIGTGTLNKVLAHREAGQAIQKTCRIALQLGRIRGKAATALNQLLELLHLVSRKPPAEAIELIVEQTGYRDYLGSFSESAEDYDMRLENLHQMGFSASQHRTIAGYLEDCALVREDQDDADDGRGVRLSTFHAAKGLEYQVVFVIGLEEGLLPHWRSVTSAGEDPETAVGDPGLEEERRLLYVGMTRAVDRLHLSRARARRGEFNRASRFLDEIPKSYLEIAEESI